MTLACEQLDDAPRPETVSTGPHGRNVPARLSATSIERTQHTTETVAADSVGRLIFVAAGMMLVTIDGEMWPLLPQRALWVPRHTEWQMHCRSDVAAHVLGVDSTDKLPADTAVIDVPPLFRELILEAVRLSAEGGSAAEWAWIEPPILSRIVTRQGRRSKMRAPTDPRLMRICNEIITNPSNGRTIDDWATEVGMSRRTLTRHFRDETGLSFSMWRQQARLQEAIARLEMGQPITSIAFDIGYESPASFSNVFRQTFGTSPSRFLGST